MSHGLKIHRPDVLEMLLSPLREKRTVVLVVEDIRLPKKTRRYRPKLVITPIDSSNALLVAMPPYGAEIIDPSIDLRPSVFARLGLSFSLARALSDALKHVLWRTP